MTRVLVRQRLHEMARLQHVTLSRSPESVLVGSGDGGWVHRVHETHDRTQ